jgi:hypothetical protein
MLVSHDSSSGPIVGLTGYLTGISTLVATINARLQFLKNFPNIARSLAHFYTSCCSSLCDSFD